MINIISTNFAPAKIITLLQMRLTLWGVSALVLCLLSRAVVLDNGYKDELQKLDAELVELNVRYNDSDTTSHVLQHQSALKEVERRIGIVNDLIAIKGLSTIEILKQLESIMPKNVVLISFVHSPKLGEFDVVIESKDTLSLTSFVHNLESDKSFKQVLISRQSHGGNGDESNAYEIKVLQYYDSES